MVSRLYQGTQGFVMVELAQFEVSVLVVNAFLDAL